MTGSIASIEPHIKTTYQRRDPYGTILNPDFADALCTRIQGDVTNDELAADSDGRIRQGIVDRLEYEVAAISDEEKREMLRLDTQLTWNKHHPNARILEWRRDHITYESPCVVEDAREVRGVDGQTHLLLRLLEKATDKDLTDYMHHVDFMLRKTTYELAKLKEDIALKHVSAVVDPRAEAFQSWMQSKYAETDNQRYDWDPNQSVKKRQSLWHEFLEETGYQDPHVSQYADQSEYEQVEKLDTQRRHFIDEYRALVNRYQIDGENIAVTEPSYYDHSRPLDPEVDPISGETMQHPLSIPIYVDPDVYELHNCHPSQLSEQS